MSSLKYRGVGGWINLKGSIQIINLNKALPQLSKNTLITTLLISHETDMGTLQQEVIISDISDVSFTQFLRNLVNWEERKKLQTTILTVILCELHAF